MCHQNVLMCVAIYSLLSLVVAPLIYLLSGLQRVRSEKISRRVETVKPRLGVEWVKVANVWNARVFCVWQNVLDIDGHETAVRDIIYIKSGVPKLNMGATFYSFAPNL